jgi:hypothetical protein
MTRALGVLIGHLSAEGWRTAWLPRRASFNQETRTGWCQHRKGDEETPASTVRTPAFTSLDRNCDPRSGAAICLIVCRDSHLRATLSTSSRNSLG